MLLTCSRCISLKSYQDTIYQFLQLLKIGVEAHNEYIDKKEDEKDLNDPKYNIVGFATSLAFALKDAVAASEMHMERLSELYASTAYYKLIISLKQVVQDIYNILMNDERELNVFLNISRDALIQVTLYFYSHYFRPGIFPASIDIPSPVFLDMTKSYHHILHEIAHLQHTRSLESAKKSFLDMILVYITICVLSDVNARQGKCPIFKEKIPTFEYVFETLEGLESVKSLNVYLGNNDVRFPIFVEKVGEALNNVGEKLTTPSSDIEVELLKTLAWFQDKGISTIVFSTFSSVFTEAEADILMCEMAGKCFGLEEYIDFLDAHFRNFGAKPLKSDHAFILRVCLVVEYFVQNRGAQITDDSVLKVADFNINKYYGNWKPVWVPFMQYVKKWKTADNEKIVTANESERVLFDKLEKLWNTERSPAELSVPDQIEFHVNNWFRWSMEIEKKIDVI